MNEELQVFGQKLAKLKTINEDLNQKVEQYRKTDEELQATSEELAQVKQEFFKAHQTAEDMV